LLAMAAATSAPNNIREAQYDTRVNAIENHMEATMQQMGRAGLTPDQAEEQWGRIATTHLLDQKAMLQKRIAEGKVSKVDAVKTLADEYSAVKAAATRVEQQLKQYRKVPQNHHDAFHLPPPPPTDATDSTLNTNTAPCGDLVLPSAAPVKDCAEAKSKGLCSLMKTQAQHYCPKTCGLCGTNAIAPSSVADAADAAAKAEANRMPASLKKFLEGLSKQPAFASDPDTAEQLWLSEVAKIKALEEKALKAAAEHGLSLDAAEAAWAKVAQKHLADEKHALDKVLAMVQNLENDQDDNKEGETEEDKQIKSDMRAARLGAVAYLMGELDTYAAAGRMPNQLNILSEQKEREVLEDSYRAVVEAAKQVEKELKEADKISNDHTSHIYNVPTAATAANDATNKKRESVPLVPMQPAQQHDATSTTDPRDQTSSGRSASADATPLPPPIPQDPDAAEQQWEEEVVRIVNDEKRILHRLGLTPKADGSRRNIDEAEHEWARIAHDRLQREAKILRKAVLAKKIGTKEAEERLRDDYNAVREAARRVDMELAEHGINPKQAEAMAQEHTLAAAAAVATEPATTEPVKEKVAAEHSPSANTHGYRAPTGTPAPVSTPASTKEEEKSTSDEKNIDQKASLRGASTKIAFATDSTDIKIASSPASDSDPDSTPEPHFHPPHGYTTTVAAAAGVSLFALIALSIMAVVAAVKHRKRRQQGNVSAGGSSSSSSRGTLRVVQGSTAPASPGEARVTTTNFVQML